MRSRRTLSLKDVLADWIRSSKLEGPLARGQVIAVWEELLSEQMRPHIGKAWVRGDKLFVQVKNAAWRQELHLRREEWRRRLNQDLGTEAVSEIVFR
ncbi:MAG: DUF721 domain-containing protein [Bacteroidetes bacterium]|nr:DUF721 domain-containing protein [Bacteroidota bacterium]MDA0875189.1 DUF721 domain-containing protein [Bacteroidota bacterium]